MKIIRESKLAFIEDTSDKIYNLALYGTDDGQYSVITEYGRRTAVDLKVIIKHQGNSYRDANYAYDEVLNAKWAKGYRNA